MTDDIIDQVMGEAETIAIETPIEGNEDTTEAVAEEEQKKPLKRRPKLLT